MTVVMMNDESGDEWIVHGRWRSDESQGFEGKSWSSTPVRDLRHHERGN